MPTCASRSSSPTSSPGPERDAAEGRIRDEVARLKEKALAAGGLYIIGTERHESRRIDNQLRGRSGRQGDPGHSKFFLSLQDDLMRIFGSDRMDGMLQKLGLKEDEAIIHPWINKALEKAQQKVEARNFDIRKNILKYDNVLNDQRKVIFEQRRELMAQDSVAETIADFRHQVVDEIVGANMPENAYPEQWNTQGLAGGGAGVLNLDLPIVDWAKEEGIADEELRNRIAKAADEAAAARAAQFGPDIMRQVEKAVLLQTLDHLWREHIVTLDHLRQVVGLRGYAQRDPLNEYKAEAFELFEEMTKHLREAVTGQMMRVEVMAEPPPEPVLPQMVGPPRRPDDRRGRARSGGCRVRGLRRERFSRRPGAGARPERPGDLGPGRPQRALSLRLRQEVQALPRATGLATRRPGSKGHPSLLPQVRGLESAATIPSHARRLGQGLRGHGRPSLVAEEPDHDRPDRHVEHRRQEEAEDRHARHAEDDGRADRLAHLRARARRDGQRHDAEDEGEGRHQDRPQAQAAGLDDGCQRRIAMLLALSGEFDDQDGVLGRQADQHDEGDLRHDVVVHAADSRRRGAPARIDMGTIRMMASGRDQLSYCAARNRKTNRTAMPKT